MAASMRRYLVESIALVIIVYSFMLLRGIPQIWVSQIMRWRCFMRHSTSWGIVFGEVAGL
jgi:hypothetical protein